MQIRSLLTLILGAVALATISPSANATLPIYNAGELFLGFRTAEGGTDYLVNIGNVSQFASLSAGSSVTVNTGGNIVVDLASNNGFGSDWFTAGDVLWGIYGGTWNESTGADNVLYASRVRSSPGVQSIPWNRRNDTAQSFSIGDLKALGQYYTNFGEATVNSTKGTYQSAGSTNSYAYYTAQNSDFRLGGTIEGTVGSVLDLYRINPATGANQPATLLGSFTIASNGVITFTAVPEPSTIVLLGLAGFGLVLFARRGAASRRI